MTSSLPTSARARLEHLRSGARLHTSYLSAASAAAMRSTGFTPVGDVMGCATMQIRFAYLEPCGGFRMGAGAQMALGATRLSGGPGSYRRQLRSLYATSLRRLTDEAAAMGADGVVGISLTFAQHETLHEVVAVGTGVRAAARRRSDRRPFTTDLSGSDLAKLLLGGWAPVALHVATEVGRCHDTSKTVNASNTAGSWSGFGRNLEISSLTQLLQDTKTSVRTVLAGQVAKAGADGGLLSSLSTRTRSAACARYAGAEDHIALCVAVGTSVVRFGAPRHPGPTLSIMPVNTRGARP